MQKATIVYRRTIEEAPADIDEVMAVQGMGIPIIQEFAPGEIIGSKGHVTAMKFNGRDNESELIMKLIRLYLLLDRLLVTLQKISKLAEKYLLVEIW